ncbi:type IV secretion system DNA-binding domain-containing protein, partial [Escherichia coli]|uniref:type IV secretion system DNA-binding domain-containing protein n=3 Tax=Enterobacterales TaxID=91347 RepID=UPI00207B85B5
LALPTGPRFSFRDWAHNEDSDAWVFITVRDDMKETLKPMMTMMLESAMSAILTLEPSEDRLIVTAIDEAGTLHEIPSLCDYISTCRKFGGFPFLGFQSNAQIESTYGDKKAQVLMDSIGSLAAFRINGIKGAGWLAEQLGDQEVEKPNENTSYGANEVRDATTINRASKEQNLVLKSQISSLPDNVCYLRLGRGLPVAKIRMPKDKMKLLHPGIIETKALKDESFLTLYKQENEIEPEAVLEAVFKDMDSAELKPQKPVGNAPPDDDAGKTQEQVLDEVINSFTFDNEEKLQKNNKINTLKSGVNVASDAKPATESVPPESKNAEEESGIVNPVALAMQTLRSNADSDTEDSDESDFNQMYAEDPHFQQLMDDFNQRSEQKDSGNNSTATKNIEKSLNQPDISGGF